MFLTEFQSRRSSFCFASLLEHRSRLQKSFSLSHSLAEMTPSRRHRTQQFQHTDSHNIHSQNTQLHKGIRKITQRLHQTQICTSVLRLAIFIKMPSLLNSSQSRHRRENYHHRHLLTAPILILFSH